jgi:hypothetical protein
MYRSVFLPLIVAWKFSRFRPHRFAVSVVLAIIDMFLVTKLSVCKVTEKNPNGRRKQQKNAEGCIKKR